MGVRSAWCSKLVAMSRALLYLSLLLLVVTLVHGAVVSSTTLAPSSDQRDGKTLGRLLFGNRCPVPFPICPHDCSVDPAVVHGYCCGCGGPFDWAPVRCPDWLQCPLRPEPLCSDYRFVMDCCCGFPFLG